MKQLHLWIATLFAWLCVFYNVERLLEPINIASFVYLLAPLLAAPLILVPQLSRIKLRYLAVAVVPIVVGTRLLGGYSVLGPSLALIVTEAAATICTMLIAQKIAGGLIEFRAAAVTTLVSHLHDRSRPFDEAQSKIVREIRRARLFGRPMAMLAVRASEQSLLDSLDRFSRDIQETSVRQYGPARLAACLTAKLKDHDIIIQGNDHFLVLLPETDRSRASHIANDIQQAVGEELDIGIRFGLSMFPEDEVTLAKLMDHARHSLDAHEHPDPVPVTGDALGTTNCRTPRSMA